MVVLFHSENLFLYYSSMPRLSFLDSMNDFSWFTWTFKLEALQV